MTRHLLALAVALLVPGTASTQGTRGDAQDALNRWLDEYHAAVVAYRGGDRDTALRLAAARSLVEQRKTVQRLLGVLDAESKNPGSATGGDAMVRSVDPATDATSRESLKPFKFAWRLSDLPAAGALHMEAALEASQRDGNDRLRISADHIRMGRAIFDYHAAHGGDHTAAPRWELAIGLTAMADGRFAAAAALLDDGCDAHQGFAPLSLACGSMHEALAMVPDRVANPSRSGAPPDIEGLPIPGGRARIISAAGEARAARLKRARQQLDRAARLDRSNPEAAVRLAHVALLEDRNEEAALLLDPVVARSDLTARHAYLARLLMGEVQSRLGRVEAALRWLDEAVAVWPSGQSAYLAAASASRARGDSAAATAYVHRMIRAPLDPPDPWVGYRFGQHWIPEPLIEELRREVQHQ